MTTCNLRLCDVRDLRARAVMGMSVSERKARVRRGYCEGTVRVRRGCVGGGAGARLLHACPRRPLTACCARACESPGNHSTRTARKDRMHRESDANVDAGEQRPICREARGVEVSTCPQTASSEAWLITKTNSRCAPALEKANEAGGGRER